MVRKPGKNAVYIMHYEIGMKYIGKDVSDKAENLDVNFRNSTCPILSGGDTF